MNKFTLKWSIIWTLIHSLLFLLFALFFKSIGIALDWLFYILLGLGLTLVSRFISSKIRKRRFRLNKRFIFWWSINTSVIWTFSLALLTLNIGVFLINAIIIGFMLMLFGWVIPQLNISRRKLLIIAIILFAVLILATAVYPKTKIVEQTNFPLSSSFSNSLNSIFSNIFPSSCPQIEIPLLENKAHELRITKMYPAPINLTQVEYGAFLFQIVQEYSKVSWESAELIKEYYEIKYVNGDGSDPQKGWDLSVYSTEILAGFGSSSIVACREGKFKGENLNYYYCDSGNGLGKGIPYLEKIDMNQDGTMGETIRKSFVNVYDSDKQFIKTVCGKPPEEIVEENIKQQIGEIKEVVNLFS